MKKNKKLIVLVALFLAVFAIGGTLAYLTDTTEETKNVFTFGKVEIELEEEWVASDATDLIPGSEVTKKPKVTVKSGSKDAFIFMEVTLPDQVNSKDVFDALTISSDWALVSGNVYAYVGSDTSTMQAVAAGSSTSNIFESVKVNSNLKGADINALNALDEVAIKVKAYAIQAENLDSQAPAAVWSTLQSQNN